MRGVLYRLTFPNGKAYVGITNDFNRRMNAHRRSANKYPQPVCRAIAKTGWDNVVREILVVGSYAYIRQLESLAIVAFNTRIPNGYNVSEGGEFAPSLAPEVRAKISKANSGKIPTTAQRQKQAESMRLKWLEPEYRAKTVAAATGNKRSDETKKKQSIARLGMKFSDEHRAKLSAARKGKIVHSWSEESRKKASESRKKMLEEKVAKK